VRGRRCDRLHEDGSFGGVSVSNSLVQQLPYRAQNVFRLKMLQHLLLVEPERWRLRRTESYTAVDLDTYTITTSIDFRIRRYEAVGALEQTRARCSSPDERRRVARLLGRERDGATDGNESWDLIDGLLPVAWLYGPLTNLTVALDGVAAVPLTRYQTAEVVAHCVDETYSLVTNDYPELPRSIRELVWVLVASDSVAISASPSLATIGPKADSYNGDAYVREWFRDVLMQVELGQGLFLESAYYVEQTRSLLRRSMSLLRDEYGDGHVPEEQCRNPFWNPLLAFRSYILKRVSWDCRNSDPPRETPEQLAIAFLAMCHDHLDLLEWARDHAESPIEDSVELASFLADVLFRVTWAWPVIVRAPMTVDESHRVTYSVSGRFLGGRRTLREERYPLSSGDALSYHVEVCAPHSELRLKKHSGQVELPHRNFGTPALKALCADRWCARIFPLHRIPAHKYFQRADESSETIHAYYDAPLTTEQFALPASVGDSVEGDTVRLVVPHYILGPVKWTNRIVTLIIVTLGIYIAALSMASTAGELPIEEVDMHAVARGLSSAYIGVILLFTLERHNNPIVAESLKWQWRLIVLSLALATIAVIGWSAHFHPSAWPGVGPWLDASWLRLSARLMP